MKNTIVKITVFIFLLLASKGFCDGWSDPSVGSGVPLTIETVLSKDDGSVIVKFKGYSDFYWFKNEPNLLSIILTAKSTGSTVRAYVTSATGYYGVTDVPGYVQNSTNTNSSAHYLGAIQTQ